MSAHEQVWVKVNAPVDKGISPLIAALSAFPKLQTIESCEDTAGYAWVCFIYGDLFKPCDELAPFVLEFIGPKLAREFGDRIRISLQVSEAGIVRAEMAVDSKTIPAVVELLNRLHAERPD